MYIVRAYSGWFMSWVHFKCYIKVSLTSKYNYHLRKTIPVRKYFLTDAKTDAHIEHIDIRCVIHNLRLQFM